MVFRESDRDFMSKNMRIIVESIEEKLDEPCFAQYKETAVTAIAGSIKIIEEFEASGIRRDPISFRDNQAEESINAFFLEIDDEIEDAEVCQVFDALRSSFVCYAYGGLQQLYTTLYRGCDISELENRSFGQAWSTSLEAATEFAYVHYSAQDWFNVNKRVVLETRYLRDDVLFSKQSIECEVVVDVAKLSGVSRHI